MKHIHFGNGGFRDVVQIRPAAPPQGSFEPTLTFAPIGLNVGYTRNRKVELLHSSGGYWDLNVADNNFEKDLSSAYDPDTPSNLEVRVQYSLKEI